MRGKEEKANKIGNEGAVPEGEYRVREAEEGGEKFLARLKPTQYGGPVENAQLPPDFWKGRGAQINTSNPYLKNEMSREHIEGLDSPEFDSLPTEYIRERPKKIVNKVDSPDIPLPFSMNPYQGCEHGCIYCYARNTHQYWGLSAGLDFERKIIIKDNAAEKLEECLRKPNWEPAPIMLSGNTDCYQPIERELKITRRMLQVLLKYKHPVGIITKNSLILRDLDILTALAQEGLVHVSISVTTLDEGLRRRLEPRTASASRRLHVIERLSAHGIPVSLMAAPIIPGLNNHEIPALVQAAAQAGALRAGYTMVRLNGAVGEVFTDWIHKVYPQRAEKVLRQIAEAHGGQLNDSRFGQRMRGEGAIAEAVRSLFKLSVKQYMSGREMPPYNLDAFIRTKKNGQMSLF